MNLLYARVSTVDQTIAHQRAQAEKAGFALDDVIEDAGVSGVSTKFAERPGGRRLLDKVRRGDTVVVRWVDRLGRNYEDVTETIRALMQQGVVIRTVINGMTFDGATTDPVQKAIRDSLIAFMAATAQAQAEATKDAQKAGIAHAKGLEGAGKYRGRKPAFNAAQLQRIEEMLAEGATPSVIAKEVGVPRATVYRVKDEPAKMHAVLQAWR